MLLGHEDSLVEAVAPSLPSCVRLPPDWVREVGDLGLNRFVRVSSHQCMLDVASPFSLHWPARIRRVSIVVGVREGSVLVPLGDLRHLQARACR